MTLKLPLLKRSLDGSGETVVLLEFLNTCACGNHETWVFWWEKEGGDSVGGKQTFQEHSVTWALHICFHCS